MATAKKGYANRGAYAEGKVKAVLHAWAEESAYREAHRLVDTKAAGRIIKAASADFEYYTDLNLGVSPKRPVFGLIEVKQTEHEYRLARDKVSQLPRLRKREKCGATSCVLVYHSTLGKWRVATIPWLANNGDIGSWNLKEFPLFDSCGLALASFHPEAFQ